MAIASPAATPMRHRHDTGLVRDARGAAPSEYALLMLVVGLAAHLAVPLLGHAFGAAIATSVQATPGSGANQAATPAILVSSEGATTGLSSLMRRSIGSVSRARYGGRHAAARELVARLSDVMGPTSVHASLLRGAIYATSRGSRQLRYVPLTGLRAIHPIAHPARQVGKLNRVKEGLVPLAREAMSPSAGARPFRLSAELQRQVFGKRWPIRVVGTARGSVVFDGNSRMAALQELLGYADLEVEVLHHRVPSWVARGAERLRGKRMPEAVTGLLVGPTARVP